MELGKKSGFSSVLCVDGLWNIEPSLSDEKLLQLLDNQVPDMNMQRVTVGPNL